MTAKELVLCSLLNGATTARQIQKETGKTKAIVNTCLRQLVGDGYATKENVSTRGGVTWKYTLTPKARMPESKRNYGPLSMTFKQIGESFA